ncbi:MAG TPA: hypothetical protein DCG48_07390 [Rhodospirillaceae bacterium]|nr:hypothetical protein [Rhodospirillaceae bacterium]|tara:strand:- start:116 stop:1951 length:1836 start_codon:yes stop_codon:yes gene_type:complete
MAENKDVRNYLDHFLASGVESDYAVMLNGPWGAGKTHFIKSYFREGEPAVSSEGAQNRLTHLYVSLYGVRSTAEITDQFFTQSNPMLGSKVGRLVGSVSSRVLNDLAGADVSDGARSLFKDWMTRLDGKALVFDDLERCAMPLVDVMGFINAYVEHDGLKVIVIANEDEIPDKQREAYAQKKEKLVGKTLRVSSDPAQVLDAIISKIGHQKVKETIERERAELLKVFEASGALNFRSLRAILFDFERLVSDVDPRLATAPEAMKDLLLLMIAVGVEFRSGKISAVEVAQFEKSFGWRFFKDDELSPEDAKAKRLFEKYPDIGWHDWAVPAVALSKLFESGIVDTASCNERLGCHPSVVGRAAAPAWRQLWSLYQLSRTDYLDARDQLVSELEQREISHPGVILHVAGFILRAAEYDDHLLGENADVVEYFRKYVADVLSVGKLVPEREVFGFSAGSYGNLGYHSENAPKFLEISKLVKEATFSSFSEHMRSAAPGFLKRLKSEPSSALLLHRHDEEGNFADAAILHYIEIDKFVPLIVNDWTVNRNLFASLVERYETDRHQGNLAEEYDWLKGLRASLEALIAAAKPPHQKLLQESISSYFSKIDVAISGS